MAKKDHLLLVRTGEINSWRAEHPEFKANLRRADFRLMGLRELDLRDADLQNARFDFASLYKVDLRGANLANANFDGTILQGVKLGDANLKGSRFIWARLVDVSMRDADLSNADLSGAMIRGSNLRRVRLHQANLMNAGISNTALDQADLTGSWVFGVSAWRLTLKGATQTDLVITPPMEAQITVDSIEVAQFIDLLLHNEKIRQVLDTISSKVVLILGRFTEQRKPVLDALKIELRKYNLLPVLFDFEKPASRTLSETVSTLAHIAKFVIADITDARNVAQELQRIAPLMPSVPVQPILHTSDPGYAMFEDFRSYPWVREVVSYSYTSELMDRLPALVRDLAPA
jgi:uncharacterized protein YjbI with pentapeptide repeats